MIPIEQMKKLRLSRGVTWPWALLVNYLAYQVSGGTMQMRWESLMTFLDPS